MTAAIFMRGLFFDEPDIPLVAELIEEAIEALGRRPI
jgi:hypothetical protein